MIIHSEETATVEVRTEYVKKNTKTHNVVFSCYDSAGFSIQILAWGDP